MSSVAALRESAPATSGSSTLPIANGSIFRWPAWSWSSRLTTRAGCRSLGFSGEACGASSLGSGRATATLRPSPGCLGRIQSCDGTSDPSGGSALIYGLGWPTLRVRPSCSFGRRVKRRSGLRPSPRSRLSQVKAQPLELPHHRGVRTIPRTADAWQPDCLHRTPPGSGLDSGLGFDRLVWTTLVWTSYSYIPTEGWRMGVLSLRGKPRWAAAGSSALLVTSVLMLSSLSRCRSGQRCGRRQPGPANAVPDLCAVL